MGKQKDIIFVFVFACVDVENKMWQLEKRCLQLQFILYRFFLRTRSCFHSVTQIVKKPLVPPGIAMLMKFCADFTTINLKDMAQYYISSGWNIRNLTKSIGTDQGSFNVFAPIQDGYGEFNIEVAVRISTLEWQRHLWDFLLHMTVEPQRSMEEWKAMTEDAGGYMQVKMLSGFNTTFEIDEDGELTIDGARFLKPYDMLGVDG